MHAKCQCFQKNVRAGQSSGRAMPMSFTLGYIREGNIVNPRGGPHARGLEAPESGRFKGLQGSPEGTKGEIGIPLSPLAPAERVPPPEASAYSHPAAGAHCAPLHAYPGIIRVKLMTLPWVARP